MRGRWQRLRLLVQVSRPVVWPVLPLVYFLGLHAAGAQVTPAAVAQMLLFTLPMNLVGCGLNDLYDIESDRRSRRRRAIWAAVVSHDDRPVIWRTSLAMMPLVLLGSLATRNPYNLLATAAELLVAWVYSVPPLRLKERPPLDSLANGLGYFLLPFVMGYSLGADPLTMPLKYYLLAVAVCGIHALATAADYEADRAAGQRTLAVVTGKRTAAVLAAATFAVAWSLGDYHGTAVRVFLAIGLLATLAAALWPHRSVIAAACVAIFLGFLLAAVCHVAG